MMLYMLMLVTIELVIPLELCAFAPLSIVPVLLWPFWSPRPFPPEFVSFLHALAVYINVKYSKIFRVRMCIMISIPKENLLHRKPVL